MGEVRTSVVVEGKAKGLENVDRGVDKVRQTIAAAVSAQTKQLQGLEASVAKADKGLGKMRDTAGGLAKPFLASTRAMDAALEQFDRKTARRSTSWTKQFDKLGKDLKKAFSFGYGAMESSLDKLDRKDARDARRHEKAVRAQQQAAAQGSFAGELQALLAKHAGGGGAGGAPGAPGGGGGGSGGGGGHGGHGGAPAHHGAFLQGFLEGAMPGNLSRVIDRGPGAMRQAAGIYLGDKGRAMVGGLASVPLAGEEGLVRAMEGIPGVGGAGSALLQRSLGQAHRAIGLRQQEAQLAPYLAGVGMRHGRRFEGAMAREYSAAGVSDADADAQLAQARQDADRKFDPRAHRMDIEKRRLALIREDVGAGARALARKDHVDMDDIGPLDFLTGAGARRNNRYEARAADAFGLTVTPGFHGMSGIPEDTHNVYGARAEAPLRQAGRDKAQAEQQDMIDRQRALARSRVEGRTVDPIEAAGVKYGGMDIGQTQQFLASMARAGGGTAVDIGRQHMTGLGIAAQSALGLDASVSGKFVQAGRIGGIAGGGLGGGRAGQGAGNELFAKSIGDAMRLGLEGSDLTDYMQQMAQGIDSWKTTGIPLAADSIGRMAQSLASAGGMGGARGAIAAQSTVSGLQRLGTEGPQSETDLLALQTYGGYKGGGMAEYLKSAERLQSGEFTPEQHADYMRKSYLRGTGGGTDANSRAGGTMILQQAAAKRGVNMSLQEAELYGRQLTGDLKPGEEAQLQALQPKVQKMSSKQVMGRIYGRAAANNEGVVAEEAQKSNEQYQSGDKFIKTVQEMDSAMQRTVTSFGQVFSDGINKLAETLNQLVHAGNNLVAPTPHGVRGPHAKAGEE